MAGIEDVARAAGVSKGLVSRYINGHVGVGAGNKEKIAEAIKMLGYRRNDIARSLVRQKTDAIGVVMDTLCLAFFHDLIRGLEIGGQEAGYKIIFCDCMSDVKVKRSYIDYLSHSRVDGLVMYGSFYTDNQIVEDLAGSKFPLVLIENNVPGVAVDKILVDNRNGIVQMVHRLYNKGYRDIHMMCWNLDTFAGLERLEGYKAGMSECGLKFNEETIIRTNTQVKMKRVLHEMIDRDNLPEALIFGADELAFAAIEVLEDYGIRIPKDIAVTGFDYDHYLSRDRLMPKLTTLEQPLFEMGRSAVKMLSERIANPTAIARSITYDVKLIEGATD